MPNGLPDEKDITKPGAPPSMHPADEGGNVAVDIGLTRTFEPKAKDPEIEIVVEDDTPEADKGKRVATPETDGEDEESEAATYTHGVKKRIDKLTEARHAERRRAEKAERERDAQNDLIKRLIADNETQKKVLSNGEDLLIKSTKGKLDAELERVNRQLKDAIDAGDSDAQVKAQGELARIQVERERIASYEPQWQKSAEAPPPAQDARPPARPQVSEKAAKWFEDNPWFASDDKMHRFAVGVHEKLINDGITDKDENYWKGIDKAVRKEFPEWFSARGKTVADDDRPARQSNLPDNVAPVVRTPDKSSPTRVTLTQSELAMAKRLNITPQRYAAQKLRLLEKGK